jgi:hypothetical protein
MHRNYICYVSIDHMSRLIFIIFGIYSPLYPTNCPNNFNPKIREAIAENLMNKMTDRGNIMFYFS